MTGRDEMRARCERDMSQRSSGRRLVMGFWRLLGLHPISHTSRTSQATSQRSQENRLHGSRQGHCSAGSAVVVAILSRSSARCERTVHGRRVYGLSLRERMFISLF